MRKTYAENIVQIIRNANNPIEENDNNVSRGYAIICYDKVDFTARDLMNNRLEMIVPKGLSETSAEQNYENNKTLEYIYEATDIDIHLMFAVTQQIISENESEFIKDELLEEIKNLYPLSKIYDNETIETDDGNVISFFSFEVKLVHKEILNTVFLFMIKQQLIVGSFHCSLMRIKDWRPIFKQMLLSIKEKKC